VNGRRPLFSGDRRVKRWRLLALAQQLDAETVHQVFTHSSWVSERGRSYERLEFLGDSVLSLAVTTELYRRFPGHNEGDLARLRAYVVSRATCAKVAKALGLGGLLKEVGAGLDAAELDQLMANQNVLADVTESLIGALYLTFGFDAVRPAVIEAFAEHIDYGEKSYVDFKTELQEQLAKMGTQVTYSLVGCSGPPHERNFTVEAVVDGETLGRGVGPSKKRAEQEAAAEAMAELAGRETRRRRRSRSSASRGGGVKKPGDGPQPVEEPGEHLVAGHGKEPLEQAPSASADALEEVVESEQMAATEGLGAPAVVAELGAPDRERGQPAVPSPATAKRRRGARGRSRSGRRDGEATEG
jgi:ribonuclease-3